MSEPKPPPPAPHSLPNKEPRVQRPSRKFGLSPDSGEGVQNWKFEKYPVRPFDREKVRVKSRILGIGLFTVAVGVYAFTIRMMTRDRWEDVCFMS